MHGAHNGTVMDMKAMHFLVLSLLFISISSGCGASTGADGTSATSAGGFGFGSEGVQPVGEGSSGVVVPGAADFALFRKILDAGDVPSPDTLDDLGFFAEHKLDFKAPTCGAKLCMDARVGIRPNMITGSTCTIVQVGLNSPVKPETLDRPPLHLVVLVHNATSMKGDAIAAAREGLTPFAYLGAQEATTMEQQVLMLTATASGSNFYAGLQGAYALALDKSAVGQATRVLLVTNGHVDRGITSPTKTAALIAAMAAQDVPLTIVGVGKIEHHSDLIAFAEAGQGSLYVAESGSAVQDIFTEEQRTAVFAIARDVDIRFTAADGWAIRGVYGVRNAAVNQGQMSVRIPALYLAKRQTAADPIEGGRRGGGGVLQVELIPLGSFDDPKLSQIGSVGLDWNDPVTGKHHGDNAGMVISGLSAAKVATGTFSDFTSEKGFVMLNLYVGLKMAADLVQDGDSGAASSVLTALSEATAAWLAQQASADLDITDDLKWVNLFASIVATLPPSQQTPRVPPPNPWPSD